MIVVGVGIARTGAGISMRLKETHPQIKIVGGHSKTGSKYSRMTQSGRTISYTAKSEETV